MNPSNKTLSRGSLTVIIGDCLFCSNVLRGTAGYSPVCQYRQRSRPSQDSSHLFENEYITGTK